MSTHARERPAEGGSGPLRVAAGQRPSATATPRPNPEVVRLIQFNCQRLFPDEVVLVECFRSTLLDLSPSMRGAAPDRVRQLSEQIVRSVLWSALTRDPVPTIESTMRRLGGDHHRQGFPPSGYIGVGQALLRSVRTVSDTGWSLELSSAWIGYYSWLADLFEAGADAARSQPGVTGPDLTFSAIAQEGSSAGEHASHGPPALREPARPTTLDDVFASLRTRYFPDGGRGLASICTRVMLRTGADLRAPRPDQRADPAVVAEVLGVLMIMGFSMTTARTPSPNPVTTDRPRTGPPQSWRADPAPRRHRWFNPFHRRETR